MLTGRNECLYENYEIYISFVCVCVCVCVCDRFISFKGISNRLGLFYA